LAEVANVSESYILSQVNKIRKHQDGVGLFNEYEQLVAFVIQNEIPVSPFIFSEPYKSAIDGKNAILFSKLKTMPLPRSQEFYQKIINLIDRKLAEVIIEANYSQKDILRVLAVRKAVLELF